jgi:tRNA (guanine-N7-)-methyltransferase
MPGKAESFQARRRAFYGRRKGHKLRRGRVALMDVLLPQLALDLKKPPPASLYSLFPPAVGRVTLEIGFGGGENLVREALTDPSRGIIGCEPFVNGVAGALAAIATHAISNVRLHHGDAADVLDWLPAASIERIDILYPDPWPKKRHRKRRFVSDENIARFARVLTWGGTVRFATDIDDYAEWTLVRFMRSNDFEWTAERAVDWRKPWEGFGGTRYETKALREGRTPCYLLFRRR